MVLVCGVHIIVMWNRHCHMECLCPPLSFIFEQSTEQMKPLKCVTQNWLFVVYLVLCTGPSFLLKLFVVFGMHTVSFSPSGT